MTTGPSKDEAHAALDEFERAKEAVEAEDSRGLPMMLVAWSALTALDYAVKDDVREPAVRRGIALGCAVATSTITVLESRARRVQPFSPGPHPTRDLAPFVATLVGWSLAERLAIAGLRRSRLHRPNTAAGALLALSRPACYLLALRLLPRPVTA